MILIVLLLGASTLLYVWLKWFYSFWKRNNVVGPEPTFFIGNVGSTLTFSKHYGLAAADWYKEYSNEPYIGYYKLWKPAILVRDPELIKDMVTTNFNSFHINDTNVSKRYDPLMAASPFFKENIQEWKEARRIVSALFSPSKLKHIVPAVNGAGADFVKFIRSHSPNTDFDSKDISSRYTMESVIRSAFSIEADCFNKEQPNEFFNTREEIILGGFKLLSFLFSPNWLFERIPVSFVSPSVERWIKHLVQTNKDSRSKDIRHNDLFQTLLDIQKEHDYDEKTFRLDGFALTLFFDGMETVAIGLSYSLYELACNPECQEELYQEIMRMLSKYDGELTFEALHDMSYLNGVVLEASRMHPPALSLLKVCTKTYTLPKTSHQSKPVSIGPGTVIQFPILAIHMDPQYYPNPEVFKPERFSEEEHRKRHKCTFLTFGEGSRLCPGMKFGLIQIKVAIIHIAQNFRIKLSPKHKPIHLDAHSPLSSPKHGIFLQFEAR